MTTPPHVDPSRPDKHIDPKTGIWPAKEWGSECGRGIRYKDVGAPVASGTPGQVRKISSGRKSHRGMASDGVVK